MCSNRFYGQCLNNNDWLLSLVTVNWSQMQMWTNQFLKVNWLKIPEHSLIGFFCLSKSGYPAFLLIVSITDGCIYDQMIENTHTHTHAQFMYCKHSFCLFDKAKECFMVVQHYQVIPPLHKIYQEIFFAFELPPHDKHIIIASCRQCQTETIRFLLQSFYFCN